MQFVKASIAIAIPMLVWLILAAYLTAMKPAMLNFSAFRNIYLINGLKKSFFLMKNRHRMHLLGLVLLRFKMIFITINSSIIKANRIEPIKIVVPRL